MKYARLICPCCDMDYHVKFENIHLFVDGNVRTGRLGMNYLLIMNGSPDKKISKTEMTHLTGASTNAMAKPDMNEFLHIAVWTVRRAARLATVNNVDALRQRVAKEW